MIDCEECDCSCCSCCSCGRGVETGDAGPMEALPAGPVGQEEETDGDAVFDVGLLSPSIGSAQHFTPSSGTTLSAGAAEERVDVDISSFGGDATLDGEAASLVEGYPWTNNSNPINETNSLSPVSPHQMAELQSLKPEVAREISVLLQRLDDESIVGLEGPALDAALIELQQTTDHLLSLVEQLPELARLISEKTVNYRSAASSPARHELSWSSSPTISLDDWLPPLPETGVLGTVPLLSELARDLESLTLRKAGDPLIKPNLEDRYGYVAKLLATVPSNVKASPIELASPVMIVATAKKVAPTYMQPTAAELHRTSPTPAGEPEKVEKKTVPAVPSDIQPPAPCSDRSSPASIQRSVPLLLRQSTTIERLRGATRTHLCSARSTSQAKTLAREFVEGRATILRKPTALEPQQQKGFCSCCRFR